MSGSNAKPPYFVGVDCGTGSVRAALISAEGIVIASDVQSIQIWNQCEDFYEQSSHDIWNACCKVVKSVCHDVSQSQIHGIGFDATCSLVVLDQNFQALSVAKSGENERNIIMWMDHRAKDQADYINDTKHPVLKYVGGTISLEMEPPKLLWLKQNLKDTCWDRAGHFLDLADFLTWKATGSLTRSLCTIVAKWTFQANEGGKRTWDESFWKQIGLEDLTENNYSKIGNAFQLPGEQITGGLTEESAVELGLLKGTAVGTSLIDAHAGGVGMLGAKVKGHGLPCENQPITDRLALILGTSSCHLAISSKELLVPGVWGPYYSIMVPGYWTQEGGQSITGKLIDHMIETHPAYAELIEKAKAIGKSVYDYLNYFVEKIKTERNLSDAAYLTKELHIWPDHHGNRSPLADPTLKGMISGLSLGRSLTNLAILYTATIQSLALGTKHILDTMMSSGHSITTLFACGGLGKNTLFIQIHADVTGMPIVLPKEKDSVLVGAAILGACASHHFSSMQEAMEAMSHVGSIVQPNKDLSEYYRRKNRVFLSMVDHQREYQRIMSS